MKKRWIVSAGVALALGALATVAVAERGERMREHRQGMPWILGRLDLTDEQKERLEDLRTEHRTEMRETRNNHFRALESVLTGEQRQELEAMKDEAFYGGGRRWRGKR